MLLHRTPDSTTSPGWLNIVSAFTCYLSDRRTYFASRPLLFDANELIIQGNVLYPGCSLAAGHCSRFCSDLISNCLNCVSPGLLEGQIWRSMCVLLLWSRMSPLQHMADYRRPLCNYYSPDRTELLAEIRGAYLSVARAAHWATDSVASRAATIGHQHDTAKLRALVVRLQPRGAFPASVAAASAAAAAARATAAAAALLLDIAALH